MFYVNAWYTNQNRRLFYLIIIKFHVYLKIKFHFDLNMFLVYLGHDK